MVLASFAQHPAIVAPSVALFVGPFDVVVAVGCDC
jgi:hypothetical protein